MLLVLSGMALAGTWTCPEFTDPAGARPWYGEDVAYHALHAALRDEAEAYVPADCAWESGYDTSGNVTSTCSADGIVVTQTTSDYSGGGDSPVVTWVYTLPEGSASWTSITLTEGTWTESGSQTQYTGEFARAAWVGAPLGLPADASAAWSLEDSYDTFWGSSFTRGSVELPDCGWNWGTSQGSHDDLFGPHVSVQSAEHDVSVSAMDCGGAGYLEDVAWLDGALYGHVDATTWALADDADQDGVTPLHDCDDADPAVNACAEDVPFDGIDQDCVGGDSLDGDGDGHEDATLGGTDCDDADPTIHPRADDTPGDGLDQDCDGADDVDADGDGYTADRDDLPADCDDEDASVHPGAEDVCDEVDQDCDGVALIDADEDGHACLAAGGDDCDDTRDDVNPGAEEVLCDHVDQDCDGADRIEEVAGDGIDQDCDGRDAEVPAPPPNEAEGGCDTVPASALAPALLAAMGVLRRRRTCSYAGSRILTSRAPAGVLSSVSYQTAPSQP